MNNRKATKRALLTSVMALVMCVVMLVGTTFAWFTDTASTGVNKIQAGNLDVALEYAIEWDTEGKVTKWENAEGKTLQFKTADGRTDNILWEPGCRYQLPELRVVNKGNLALKYIIKVTGIETNHEAVPGEPNLNDVITWEIKYSDDAVWNAEADTFKAGYSLAPNASNVVTIKGEMDKNAGNKYQGLSIDGVSVTVYATQMTAEFDSIDNQYDKDAAYKGSQEFTSGTHVLNKGGVALNPNDVAVLVSGAGTDVTITGGYYDGGSGGDNRCVQVDTGAKVTIKDGTFTVGGDANGYGNSVILCDGGTVVIEGGFFYTDYAYRGFYYVLNQQNNNPGTITVKGGTFVNYDPSKGDDHLGTNFVADGYSVISETKANGDKWYTVVKGTGATAGTQADLTNAITSNATPTVKLTTAGTYTLPTDKMANKDVTIIGTKDTVIDMKNVATGQGTSNAKIALEGVTVEFANEIYKGFQHTGKLTYKDCTIKGLQFLYADDVEFINCEFVQENDDAYHVWTYGAKNVTFTDCKFNSTSHSKSVLCYIEGTGNTFTRTFNNCTFTAAGDAEKSAIMINPSANAGSNTYIVSINNCTATGYAENGISGQTIVGVKETVKDNITVTIDGTTVYTH